MISRKELTTIMTGLTQTWVGTSDADEVLIDVCDTLAHRLGLEGGEKEQFMLDCGLIQAWVVPG